MNSEQHYRLLRKHEEELADKIYEKGKNMNINTNVKKQDNSFKILLAAVAVTLLIGGLAYRNMTTAPPIPSPIQTNGMSDVDRIKQTIREKENLKDQFSQAGQEAAQAGNFDKSTDMAEKVDKLSGEIQKLYDDLHEANLKEGENGESK